jgi:hypothetical protein
MTVFVIAVGAGKETIKTDLFLTAIIALFVYYSASISFGVVYNGF